MCSTAHMCMHMSLVADMCQSSPAVASDFRGILPHSTRKGYLNFLLHCYGPDRRLLIPQVGMCRYRGYGRAQDMYSSDVRTHKQAHFKSPNKSYLKPNKVCGCFY